MTGESKAWTENRRQSPTFVNSSGRLYPVVHPTSSCLRRECSILEPKEQLAREIEVSTSRAPATAADSGLFVSHPTPLPVTVSAINKQQQRSGTRNHSSNMDMAPDCFANMDPQIESSKMAAARLQCQGQLSEVDPSQDSFPVNGDAGFSKRADSKLSEDISPSTHELRVRSVTPTKWHIDLDNVSLHSDQSFDLGYKGRLAPPCVFKMHTRAWNSQHTRPLKDMLVELLEVKYPQRREELVTEGTMLLGSTRRRIGHKDKRSLASWFPCLASMAGG
ncbi:hypothetical protein CERZMDRAFT_102302 [Cercospora zeae-maydis SCOH1-5]|uniref:Uncharacterized protein n=1 Tax=Cercospora zeae-maydis SCOH1-5 TaxID=717836 RepID=A0A6A6F505_9PEZI|nr:hypothetical protein CERZMDRAFT_102302 [Cercospora zeae-maydis SCOH1-5]